VRQKIQKKISVEGLHLKFRFSVIMDLDTIMDDIEEIASRGKKQLVTVFEAGLVL
jgi:hypothetical protein